MFSIYLSDHWKYSSFKKLFGKNKLVKYVILLLFNIKSMQNKSNQHKSIHTLFNHMLVFCKCLSWYCCFLWIFQFPLKCIRFQYYQSMLHYYYPHTKLFNWFVLICLNTIKSGFTLIVSLYFKTFQIMRWH